MEQQAKSMMEPWQVWALASAMFAGMTAIFGKIGVQKIDPDFATLIRVVIIVLFVGCLVFIRGAAQNAGAISAKTYLFLSLSGLGTGASWLCYYRALQTGPASQVAPIDKLSVVVVALAGVLFLGETLSVKNWFGVAMIAGGSVLLIAKA